MMPRWTGPTTAGWAVTCVGLEIIEKLATILEVDPAEFFRRSSRSGSRKKPSSPLPASSVSWTRPAPHVLD
jgi:hypothetical protein